VLALSRFGRFPWQRGQLFVGTVSERKTSVEGDEQYTSYQ